MRARARRPHTIGGSAARKRAHSAMGCGGPARRSNCRAVKWLWNPRRGVFFSRERRPAVLSEFSCVRVGAGRKLEDMHHCYNFDHLRAEVQSRGTDRTPGTAKTAICDMRLCNAAFKHQGYRVVTTEMFLWNYRNVRGDYRNTPWNYRTTVMYVMMFVVTTTVLFLGATWCSREAPRCSRGGGGGARSLARSRALVIVAVESAPGYTARHARY